MDKTIWINRYHQPLCASRISNRYFMGILVFVATGGGWHNFIAKKKRIQRLFKEGKKRFPKIGPLLNKLEAVAFFVFGFREQVDLPQAHDPETKSLFITAKPKTAVQEQYDSTYSLSDSCSITASLTKTKRGFFANTAALRSKTCTSVSIKEPEENHDISGAIPSTSMWMKPRKKA